MPCCAIALLSWTATLSACLGSTRDELRMARDDPDWVDTVGYTYISGVFELSNGELLLSDPRESRLESRRPGSAKRQPVGRQGFGPAEWPMALAVSGIAGDSSLLIDPFSRRVLLLAGETPLQAQALPETASLLRGVRVAGALNARTLVLIRVPRTTSIDPLVDSSEVSLLDLPTGQLTRIAMLRRADGDLVHVGNTEVLSRPAFSVAEQVAVCVDGWIAVARRAPYRVDWRAPGGRWRLGAPIEATELPMTADEESFYASRMSDLRLALPSMSPDERQVRERLLTDLPSTIPPFPAEAVHCLRSGEVAVTRTPNSTMPFPSVDVIDRAGRRVAALSFPAMTRVVGTGARRLYLVTRDSMALEHLARFDLSSMKDSATSDPH